MYLVLNTSYKGLMRILVDADACPVKDIIEEVARSMQIPVTMFIDTSHILTSDYSEIVMVSKAPDAVDFALINRSNRGDIIITQDYGGGAMALGKGAYAIHPNGKVYTNENIEVMLMERDIAKKRRRAGDRIRGRSRKRTSDDNDRFREAFLRVCYKAINSKKDEDS